MPRTFEEDTLVIASHNPGKVREIAELLKKFNINVKSASEFDELEEPEEDADNFLDNATIKSEYVSRVTGLPALADDSGLCVDGLDGAPGIFSARWGGENKDFYMAMERVGRELEEKYGDKQGDSAHFVCALSLTWPDGHTERFEGKVFGNLSFPPRGDHGFGYDPIFIADGYSETFGEMDPREKHKIGHRADAFRQLVDGCFVVSE